jgi:NAD(P)-dependent dehydrogenase (short-subunit alcohol dehydrogenase family)
VLWDIDGPALERVAGLAREALRGSGHPMGDASMPDTKAVLCKAFDIADEGALCAARDEALRVGGDIDSVLSAAAMLHGGVRAAALTGAQLARTLAVNLGGPFSLLRHLQPHLSAGLAKGGSPPPRRTLCLVSSLMGAGMGAAGLADYTASKAALNALADCLRQEVNADDSLRGRMGVHLVCPWLLDTDMFKGAFSSEKAGWLERCLLRLCPPIKREAMAAHILDGLALRHGSHWVTFKPFYLRFAALMPRVLLAPSLGT